VNICEYLFVNVYFGRVTFTFAGVEEGNPSSGGGGGGGEQNTGRVP
jgi:hypothetical protein